MKNKEFYNSLSENYDSMINFSQSVNNKIEIFKKIIDGKMKRAADIGCGTGVDSIALAKCGLEVDAFDPSEKMLEVAENNFKKYNVKINLHNSGANDITDFTGEFDIVFSLGNAFANISRYLFKKSLDNIFRILKNNGKIFIQILNYGSIIEDKNRIVNITKDKKYTYVRFYDFLNKDINFNILIINNKNNKQYNLISTRLFAYAQKDFLNVMNNIGFTGIKFYGNLKLESFSKESKDLIISAVKH